MGRWGTEKWGIGGFAAGKWASSIVGIFYKLIGIGDIVSGNDLTCTSAGAASWLDDSNVVQTTAAGVPLYVTTGNRGLTGKGAWAQELANPTAPADQTTDSLGTGFYTHWVLGPGSGAISGNGATIVGAGSATEGSPLTFEVTVAGTVDFVKTGTLTHIQLHDGVSSNYPLFAEKVAVGSRDGTITAPFASFPKLEESLEGPSGNDAAAVHEFDWTPGVDFGDTSDHNSVITVNASLGAHSMYSIRDTGAIRINDGTSNVAVDIDYQAGITYPVKLVYGPKTDEASALKMQIQAKVSGVWQFVQDDFDGSFDPTTAMTYFLSNIYQNSINNHKVRALKQSDWL